MLPFGFPVSLRPIQEAARELGLDAARLIPYGEHFAKIRLGPPAPPRGKLILVTGITPTAHGEGKTVTTIGLAQAMRRAGRRVVAALRQPSMGPVFGQKGGATGGGLARVEPGELINLHFTGDFHAITAAHNLLAALVDAHVYHGNALGIAPEQIVWPRALDVNDRSLRGRFVITAASEVMAIFALATGYDDLRQRLARITVAFDTAGRPVTAGQIGAVGAMLVLLRDALLPNLAQALDGTPVLIHAGPFANIAHGTASVLAQRLGLECADYVLNEAGFGADLGAEKYFDIVMPSSGLRPAAAVVVATARALAAQGLENLGRHLDIVRGFGVPAVVALNRFPTDTEEELAAIEQYCAARGVACGRSEVFARGGEGARQLAEQVIAAAESGTASPQPLYSPELPLAEKIETIARRVYGAADVSFRDAARASLERFTELGFGHLPVCMAKTPLSFTADPHQAGAPTGWTLPIASAVLSSGAGFVVAVAGTTMRMPGLGKHPQALDMDLGPQGELIGVC